MKRLTFLALLFYFNSVSSQDFWMQIEGMSVGRIAPVGFSVGTCGYIGMGRDSAYIYRKDVWKYDGLSNIWSQVSNYPGGGSYSATSAVVGNFAYVGLGHSGTALKADWWQYNPMTDTWIQKTNFPGSPRYGASSFVIGSKIYVITGSPNYTPFFSDCYVYDTLTDAWAQIASFPDGSRNHTNAYSFNGKGYVGLGNSSAASGCNNDFYEYNPLTNAWSSLPSLPATVRSHSSGFTIGNKLFVVSGVEFPSNYLPDLWEYDPISKVWIQRANFPGLPRQFGVAFSIDGIGYFSSGGNSSTCFNDVWRYYPINVGIEEETQTEWNLKVYPNPIEDVATIYFPIEMDDATITIYAAAGRKMQSIKHLYGQSYNIVRNDMPAGVYIMILEQWDTYMTYKFTVAD